MRQQTSRWDFIRATLEIVDAGVGQTGLSPTVSIRRIKDGTYLASGGASWDAAHATNAMSEVDATNWPGFYRFEVPDGVLTYADGRDGYELRMVEATTPVLEHVLVDVEKDVLAESIGDNGLPGTIGGAIGGLLFGTVDVESGSHFVEASASDAGGTKFYFAGGTPAVARSAAYAGRHAVLLRAGNALDLCRITGIATDGTGDHFVVEARAGGALAAISAGEFLIILLRTDDTTAEAALTDVQARLPAALVSGRMDSSVGAMANGTLTAAALATDAVTEIADGVAGPQSPGTGRRLF